MFELKKGMVMINFGFNTDTLVFVGIVLVVLLIIVGIIIWNKRSTSQVKALKEIREVLASESIKSRELIPEDNDLNGLAAAIPEKEEKVLETPTAINIEEGEKSKEADYISKNGKEYFREDIEKQIRD